MCIRDRNEREDLIMSKKNRAQHNVPRRHGDRNVQTRYSRKLQQEECGCGRTCHEGVRGAGFTFIPEVKVSIKIGELHLHGDEHMAVSYTHLDVYKRQWRM